MAVAILSSPTTKISRQFEDRLDRLRGAQKVRAIVLVGAGVSGSAEKTRRQGPAEREQAIRSIREVGATSLSGIDSILERHGGRRLAPEASALGSIPVEVDAAGIRELAEMPAVTAILEDQTIRRIR